MKQPLAALWTICLLLPAFAAAETDWAKVDAAIAKKAVVAGPVCKYGLPRSLDHALIAPEACAACVDQSLRGRPQQPGRG